MIRCGMQRVLRGVVDIFYPPRCDLCSAYLTSDENGVCATCTEALPLIYPPHCPQCCRPIFTPGGLEHLCSECASHNTPPVSRVIAAGVFRDELRELVHRYKYGKCCYLGSYFATLILAQARRLDALVACDLIVPVPLHWTRKRNRGFNQAREIGRYISRACDIPLIAPRDFRRVRRTTPQVALSAAGRRENIRGAFAVRTPDLLKGKTVALIDDVITTGATTNECARILRRAGADDVIALVIARDL